MTSQFNTTSGYGLVNAATAVASAIGQLTFPDVPDLGGNSWGNDLVKAPEAWAKGYTGKGIVVAVIDTGVDIEHEDLKDNIWINTKEIPGNGIDDDGNGYIDDINGWNFGKGQNNNNVRPGNTDPVQGHGTHVSGTIAALKNNIGISGVAYDAQIMPIRMGDIKQGVFSNFGNLADAIRYAVDNGARVINMSLGGAGSPEIQEAIAYAASRNVFVVSAAGNESQDIPSYPAIYAVQHGIAVGAVNINSRVAQFSNGADSNIALRYVVAPGASIDLGQPQTDIFSTLPANRYGYKSGTSMAAPHVAGVAALMLSANPNLTANQIGQTLTNSAVALSNNVQVLTLPPETIRIKLPEPPSPDDFPSFLPGRPLIPTATPNPVTINISFERKKIQPFSPTKVAVLSVDGNFFNLSDNTDNINLLQFPNSANKLVRGLNGNDVIQGTQNNDNINGNSGNDTVYGGNGNDTLRGDIDFDYLLGENGDDLLSGNKHNDTLSGGIGNDILRGGQGNDILLGESGDDFLSGDFGQDSLIGGLGSDVFLLRYDSKAGFEDASPDIDYVDIIRDFNVAEGDKIALSGLSFSQLAFESRDVIINGGTATPATIIRIETNRDYLGIVLNVSPNSLQQASNFITADVNASIG